MADIDPLKYLRRKDKWYLGGGNRLIWTPPFPKWLDHPGFWDKASYYNYEIEPVFTWTVLDEDGIELELSGGKRMWDPAKLKTEFKIPNAGKRGAGLRFEESKCCLPEDIFSSLIRIKNISGRKRKLTFIAWSIQPNYRSAGKNAVKDLAIGENYISFRKKLCRNDAPPLWIECGFGMDKRVESYGINLTQEQHAGPHWRFTPLAGKMEGGRLRNEIKLTGVDGDGLVFIAIQTTIRINPRGEGDIALYFSAAPSSREVKKRMSGAARSADPVARSERNWNRYFSNLPYFECSDEFITRYYWYRWYGLRLLTTDVKEGNYRHPFVSEGIGYFRAPISYSAVCHVFENRWKRDPALARGSILTFLHNQRKDGGLRGYIDLNHYRQEMFYHANWGRAVIELDRLHPDAKYLRRIYPGLARYANYFDRERDPESSGLYNIENHYETGQEYMHRYITIDRNADKENWGKVFRAKGVDVSVYIYELKKALAVIAERIGTRGSEAGRWRQGAGRIKNAILNNMWDPADEMFHDIDPRKWKRTGVKSSTCFYPYFTDIVSKEHLPGLKKHLFNTDEFWTTYPVPSSSADDPYFSAAGEWKGKRMNCPWNGRVWPMTNSHIIEALAETAARFGDDELRNRCAELIKKFIRMMFYGGDPKLPNCFEHYNPLTGEASSYRGIDDYQHSWVNDIILKYVCGIRFADGSVTLDPLPMALSYIRLKNLNIGGKEIKLSLRPGIIDLTLDGNDYEISRPKGAG